jgi:hypothetical protein
MTTAKTWLLIILGFFAICVLGLVVIAGAGFYFVSKHIATEKATSVSAVRMFDESRARFKTAQPLIEIDALERPRELRSTHSLPTSPEKPKDLYVLAWNPDDGHVARISLPFWVLRFGRQKMDFLKGSSGLDFERLNVDVAELERIGPALVLDYRAPGGERVLIWTQ